METKTRKIVHVDMDAFYASVEQRDDPSLRGRPVVVAWRGPRSVVCAASYEARRFGVRSAMPAARAERLCPSAVFVPPDFARYREVSARVREIFARHTDLVEPLSLDEAYLDVTAPRLESWTATRTAQAIRAAIFDELSLTASAGVAPNKFVAKIASDHRKPDGLFVVRPDDVLPFLAPLPIERLPGVGRVTASKLHALGVARVAELRAFAPRALEAHFGRWGRRLHELAHGIDESPVRRERPSKQISAEDTFESDRLLSELSPHLERLVEKVWARYTRHEGRIARTVVLKLKTSDFKTITRSVTQSAPPGSERELFRLVTELTKRVNLGPATRFRLAGVGLGSLVDAGLERAQLSLFDVEPLA